MKTSFLLSGTSGGVTEVINILKFMLWQSGHPEFQLTGKN